RFLIDDATVHLGLLGALFNRPTYSWKGHLLQGKATGEVSLSPSEERLRIEASKLVLNGVTLISQKLAGLPVEGAATAKLELLLPKYLLTGSEGALEISIEDAVIGDGKTKLSIPGDAFLSQGVTFPRTRLGQVSGRIVIEKGRGRFEDIRIHS